ncbi:major royal jelly protein-domain-containing protein, partial [Xylariaceae sp. FL0804]
MKSYTQMLVALLPGVVCAANISFISDPGVYGPPLETVHAYYGQWPTGIAVSSTGRMFSNYPGGLDPANVYNGSNDVYTVGELTSMTTEKAYPSLEFNHPPGGAINYSTTPPTSANYQNYLIGVQSVVIDPQDRLWILDTGRVLTPDGVLLTASYGGPKLVGVDLATNKVFQTIVFPASVAPGDSYLNDVRFDLGGGGGQNSSSRQNCSFAYITDSSNAGDNAIVVVDLTTGESWRHVRQTRVVRNEPQFLAFVWGQPTYYYDAPEEQYMGLPFGSDGIALSADGATLYWCPLASRYLYSAPTARLRARGPASELR